MQSFLSVLACLVCVGHARQELAQPSHHVQWAGADPQKVLQTLLLSVDPSAAFFNLFRSTRPRPVSPSKLKRSLPSADEAMQMALISSIIYLCPHHLGIPLDLVTGKPVADLMHYFDAESDSHEPAEDEQKNRKIALSLAKELEERSSDGVFELFEETPKYDTEVAVFRSPMNKRITVVYRGTSEPADWRNNLQIIRVPLQSGVWVHRGWRNCYIGDDLEKKVFKKVENLLLKYPDREVYVTGHSLGGALSMLFGVRFAQSHPDTTVKVINFGAPRVGDSGWRDLYMSLPNLAVTRVVNRNDVVPRGPMIGYKHIGHGIFVDGARPRDQSASHKPVVYPWKSDGGPINLLKSNSVHDHDMIADDGYVSAMRMATEDDMNWVPSSVDDLH